MVRARCLEVTLTLEALRRYAVARTLFAPTILGRRRLLCQLRLPAASYPGAHAPPHAQNRTHCGAAHPDGCCAGLCAGTWCGAPARGGRRDAGCQTALADELEHLGAFLHLTLESDHR